MYSCANMKAETKPNTLTSTGISKAVKAQLDRYCNPRGIKLRVFVDAAVTERLKQERSGK